MLTLFGAIGVLFLAVVWGAVQSEREAPAIHSILLRMQWLEYNPLALSSRVIPLSQVQMTPAIKRRLWNRESQELASTFAPGSSLIARDRQIFRNVLRAKSRMQNEHIRVSVESVIVVGPWARATFQTKETWNHDLNGETGTAYLRRVDDHWRVVSASEQFIPGEAPG